MAAPTCLPPLFPRFTLPTMYDLSSEYPEEPGLLDEFHFYLEIGSAWIN
ncbi:MAG: hypothetical protein KME08_11485 [Aphanothece sp. CMT-3BRIN-NPC111]|nr:hypothetical protein [Aphanothece sp. CMT-3BRIN-NPC111]